MNEATGGTFTIRHGKAVVPAGRVGRFVARIFPNCWQRILPIWMKRTIPVVGRESEPIPYDASAEQVGKAIGGMFPGATVEHDGKVITITVGGVDGR